MCIATSVGKGGTNRHDDVKTVQILLAMNAANLVPFRVVKEDGGIGPLTIATIAEFQKRVERAINPSGLVMPNSPTLDALSRAIPPRLDTDILQGIMIHAKASRVAKYAPALLSGMAANGISTPLRQAHFLAQIAQETGELTYSEEIASGEEYEDRDDLGNDQPGDGVRFKGRGLIQLTGRDNYEAFGKFKKRDFTTGDNPKLISSDPLLAVEAACWYWNNRKINALADADNLRAVTKAVNGAEDGPHTHLANRRAYLARAKFFLI